MKKKSRITAIFLSYNAAKTLEKFYRELPKELVTDIILVDDVSKDNPHKRSCSGFNRTSILL